MDSVDKSHRIGSMSNVSQMSVQLPEVSTSSLSPEECLLKLQAVLQPGPGNTTLAANQVKDAWTSYLEMVVEPAGWKAVLVPSEDTAALMEVEPGRKGAMVVEVTDIMCDRLEAEVECLAASMENKIMTVPVDELFPIKHQPFETLNMTQTVLALDLIRFFYKHLWMPWDEDSECHDWPSVHLDNRLHLHYSLTTGSGDHATAARLDELCARAELNRTTLLELEDIASCTGVDEDSDTAGSKDNDGEMSYGILAKMYELNQEQENIRREAEMLENPTLRHAVSAKTSSLRKQSRTNLNSSLLLVWKGELSSLVKISADLQTEFGDEMNVLVYPDLQHALDCSVKDDIVVIARPGDHQLRHLGGLAMGGRILSRGCPEASVTLSPGDTSSVFLALSEGRLELSGLNIDCKNVNIGLMVSAGELVIDHVTVMGGSTGVLVTGNGNLVMRDSKVTDSGLGVEVASHCKATLTNCVIDQSRIGVTVGDKGILAMKNCYVGKNEEYGLLLHCPKESKEEGVWTGAQGVSKASQRGVNIVSTELGKNNLGDIAILALENAQIESPKRSHLTRRFSTPMSGKSQSQSYLESKDSPIFPSLSRILTYPD